LHAMCCGPVEFLLNDEILGFETGTAGSQAGRQAGSQAMPSRTTKVCPEIKAGDWFWIMLCDVLKLIICY
jgi:hypothetical protein